jgi:hypothetical protein
MTQKAAREFLNRIQPHLRVLYPHGSTNQPIDALPLLGEHGIRGILDKLVSETKQKRRSRRGSSSK